MLKRSPAQSPSVTSKMLRQTPFVVPDFGIESLEGRRLLSVSPHGSVSHHSDKSYGGSGGGHGHGGRSVSEIAFSLAPSAVQTGLDSLATADGDTAPIDTTEVYLGNRNGVETYSIQESGTGTSSMLTVDAAGNAVTKPTRTTTTFGAVTDTAVTDEFTAIATATGATAPASTDSVSVSTASDGTVVYTLGVTTTNSSGKTRKTKYSVDGAGDVVGNTKVPLSVLSTAIQNGLTSNAPSGATALTSTSKISVETIDGVTLYSANYSSTGTRTTVTVNSAGTLTSKPSSTTVDFDTLSSTVQTELQTLATAEGVSTTIDMTQSVTQTTEANGTVLYTVDLTATSTSDSSETYPISITVDSAGNPTVANPTSFFGGFGFGGGMFW